jgi:hypothetical protein
VEVVTSRGRYGAERLVLAPARWCPPCCRRRCRSRSSGRSSTGLEPDFTPEVPYEAYAEGHPVYLEETEARGALRLPGVWFEGAATIDNRCIRQPYSSVLLMIEMCGGAPWASLWHYVITRLDL